MRITYLLIVSSILGAILFSSCNTVFASNIDNIGYSQIHPASPLYFLKTIREDIELKISPSKYITSLRELEFSARRIREVNTLVAINQDLIPPTLENFASHLKNLVDSHPENNELDRRIKESLNADLVLLKRIYPEVSNVRAKMAIRTALFIIIQRPDVELNAKIPICELFISEASESALNQTEKFVILNRAEQCSK